jgi:hypothetical protein
MEPALLIRPLNLSEPALYSMVLYESVFIAFLKLRPLLLKRLDSGPLSLICRRSVTDYGPPQY